MKCPACDTDHVEVVEVVHYARNCRHCGGQDTLRPITDQNGHVSETPLIRVQPQGKRPIMGHYVNPDDCFVVVWVCNLCGYTEMMMDPDVVKPLIPDPEEADDV